MFIGFNDVAPLVGAWIEIRILGERTEITITSLPSWERGLKLFYRKCLNVPLSSLPSWERGLKWFNNTTQMYLFAVAPLVGAWIEIPS